MAWYDTGTVSVTNGSTAVVGSGTDFISAKVQVGEAFYGPDGKIYEIAAIVSSTSLTLADNYLGTTQSGQTYKIVPTQSLVADLATNVSTLITDFANVRDLAGEGKFDDGTVAAPGITFNLDQDNGLYRIGANNWAMAVGGSKIVDLTSTGIDVTGTAVTDGVTVDGNLSVDGGTIKLDGNYPVGTDNVALGDEALDDGSLSGGNNTAIGARALTANTTGAQNTAVGRGVMVTNSSGINNTGMGHDALALNTSGGNNTAIGRGALQVNTTASNNTAVGYQAGYSNTTGTENLFVGTDAGYANTTGSGNTYVGRGTSVAAGVLMTTGSKNTILGGFSGNQGGLDIRTSSNNIVLSDGDGNPRALWDNAGNMYMYTSGSGIYIGGASSANLLDDYEEGTWTIVLKDGTGNTYSGTYQSRNGRYTKVGRLVQVTFELYVGIIDLTANGLTGNQAVVIAGLPFNTNSDQFTGGVVSNGNGINYSGNSLGLRAARNVDEIQMITFSAGTASNDSPVTVTQFNNGNRIAYGTLVYFTD